MMRKIKRLWANYQLEQQRQRELSEKLDKLINKTLLAEAMKDK